MKLIMPVASYLNHPPLLVSPAEATSAQLYGGPVAGQKLWVCHFDEPPKEDQDLEHHPSGFQLPRNSFFMSHDGVNFIQAKTSPEHSSDAVLVLTPALISAVITYSNQEMHLLFNDSWDGDRLMSIPLVRKSNKILEKAAFYLFSRDGAPLLEGALKCWWNDNTGERKKTLVSNLSPKHFGGVIGNLNHYINNPNAAISTNASYLLESAEITPEMREVLNEILGSSERITRLMKTLHHYYSNPLPFSMPDPQNVFEEYEANEKKAPSK